jgi:hypothetical protein
MKKLTLAFLLMGIGGLGLAGCPSSDTSSADLAMLPPPPDLRMNTPADMTLVCPALASIDCTQACPKYNTLATMCAPAGVDAGAFDEAMCENGCNQAKTAMISQAYEIFGCAQQSADCTTMQACVTMCAQ